MCSKDAERMTNHVDPDQTAPLGATWSGSALFAQIQLKTIMVLYEQEYFLIIYIFLLSRMSHKLHFVDNSKKVLDANIHDVDRYEIFDPRNPITKRRREASKQSMKTKR